MSAAPNVAVLPAVSADGATAQLAGGEILLLPGEIWQSIDDAQAAVAAAPEADHEAARTAFAGAFAQALHRRGLILVAGGDAKSTQTVGVQAYSMALEGKHVVEAKLEAIRKAVLGWVRVSPPTGDNFLGAIPLFDAVCQGVLALAGRAPPDDRLLLEQGLIRLRALHVLVAGSPTAGWDLKDGPPFPEPLAKMFSGDVA